MLGRVGGKTRKPVQPRASAPGGATGNAAAGAHPPSPACSTPSVPDPYNRGAVPTVRLGRYSAQASCGYSPRYQICLTGSAMPWLAIHISQSPNACSEVSPVISGQRSIIPHALWVCQPGCEQPARRSPLENPKSFRNDSILLCHSPDSRRRPSLPTGLGWRPSPYGQICP